MRYVIVGGGMTADAAVRGIHSADPGAPITMICRERHPPYDRPPLSKGLWKGMRRDRIWRGTDALGIELLLERSAVRLDRERNVVVDDTGREHAYDALLLATGGEPIHLPGDPEGVLYLRTLDDFHTLDVAVRGADRVVLVGGGFIGTELASVLSELGVEVHLVFMEDVPLARILPPGRAHRLLERFRERGVTVWPRTVVRNVRRADGRFVLEVRGDEVPPPADVVVAGLGITPNVSLAKRAGIAVADGIVADRTFRTSDPRIFAAGDGGSFPFPVLDRRMRVEHEDHANQSGIVAGRAMAGAADPYDHLPFFYSDVLGTSYEAVGWTDPRLELVESGDEGRGVTFYREDGRVTGVLLWNLPGRMREARSVLRNERTLAPDALRERISV